MNIDVKTPRIGLVCFGEINTPYDRLKIMHDQALAVLGNLDGELADAGIVTDDAAYLSADQAIGHLKPVDLDCLIVCLAGWIPPHAVIRITDAFRHLPLLLWGLCGWRENGRLVTTAGQAGTTALRATFAEMAYRFTFIYSIVGQPEPLDKIRDFTTAASAARRLRSARIGTMGYRDMLLYGTQYEGNSLRYRIGVEVEPFEMLEVVQRAAAVDDSAVRDRIEWIRAHWVFDQPCAEAILEKGVRYALAIGQRVADRGYAAITLIDVDGMKKLLGFPPAMVFMLIDALHGVATIPENDVMGSVTQLMVGFCTGQTATYLEYYEFFTDSVLIGVPDFVPQAAVQGDVHVLPTAFGLLDRSLLNVSQIRTGRVTCARLIYRQGGYVMHIYTGEARTPQPWEECGWTPPAPQLPSLEVFPDSCSVEELAAEVSSQHVIVSYGDNRRRLRYLCELLGIAVI